MRSRTWPIWSRSSSATSSIEAGGVKPGHQLDEFLRAWPATEAFSAHSILNRFPSLREERSAIVAVAVEDYLRRRRAAHKVHLPSFAAGFGDAETSVIRAAEVIEYFLQHQDSDDIEASECWPAVGDHMLHFELLEELGGGLLSKVFVARDESVADRLVVVKLTRNPDREIRALGRLSHAAITPILSVAEDSAYGLNVVVMPFLSRVTLFDVVSLHSPDNGAGQRELSMDLIEHEIGARNGSQPRPLCDGPLCHAPRRMAYSEWVAEIGATLADALEAAHRQGILHCDIKPSNVVLVNRSRAMLVDFNLCLGEDARRIAVGGTIPYMSQEQLCSLPLDARADVFSLGATLYHVLTGDPPFGGPEQPLSQALSVRMSAQGRSGAPFQRLAKLDPSLGRVLMRALAFEPDDRFPSADAFAVALRSCCSKRAQWRRFVHRRQQLCLAAGCSFGVWFGLLGVWQANRDPLFVRETEAAIAAVRAGDFEEGIDRAHRAIDANSESAAGFMIRADAELRLGRLHQAHDDLEQAAVGFHPVEIYALLAYVEYLLSKNDGDAIDSMDYALSLGLSEAEVKNNLGYCYFVRGDFSDALTELDDATRRDGHLVSAWMNLAALDLRLAVQNVDRPNTKYIKTAIGLAPSSRDVRQIAADVYIQDLKHGGQAIETLKEHCIEALRLGVPAAELNMSLDRVRERLNSWSLPELSEIADARDSIRTPRFVSPCDATNLAEQLLEAARQ